MHERLVVRRQSAWFDFLVECQTDPVRMPIEDPTVQWPSTTSNTFRVARIEILPLPFESAEKQSFCERLSFNPWHALDAHRPVGGINRARRVTYRASTQARHVVTAVPVVEPTEAEVAALWRHENVASGSAT
jgi:hypothetical protein